MHLIPDVCVNSREKNYLYKQKFNLTLKKSCPPNSNFSFFRPFYCSSIGSRMAKATASGKWSNIWIWRAIFFQYKNKFLFIKIYFFMTNVTRTNFKRLKKIGFEFWVCNCFKWIVNGRLSFVYGQAIHN